MSLAGGNGIAALRAEVVFARSAFADALDLISVQVQRIIVRQSEKIP